MPSQDIEAIFRYIEITSGKKRIFEDDKLNVCYWYGQSIRYGKKTYRLNPSERVLNTEQWQYLMDLL